MPHILRTSTEHKTASLADEGNSAYCQSSGAHGQICAKVAFPRYTESVKFMSQSRETASKLKPHRGLGTRLPSP